MRKDGLCKWQAEEEKRKMVQEAVGMSSRYRAANGR